MPSADRGSTIAFTEYVHPSLKSKKPPNRIPTPIPSAPVTARKLLFCRFGIKTRISHLQELPEGFSARGYASMDNEYMLFDHLRVPRSGRQSLGPNAEGSDKTGALVRTRLPAIVYGSLTIVPGKIIMHARLLLARAVTIAVRYCSVT
jgi:hypothetical protein